MRKILYGAACSLDGFITGPDGALDWLHFSPDVQAVMNDTWANADAMLMGRLTWEAARAQGAGTDIPGVQSYVFSRTLQRIDAPGVTLVRDDAETFVRNMKHEQGKDVVVMGGGVLAASLFAADLIDEVGMNIHPVLLGSGTPFFVDPRRRVPLALAESRMIDGGCLLAIYRVIHESAHRTRVAT